MAVSSPSPSAAPGVTMRAGMAGAALVAAVALAYLNSLGVPFVYDDTLAIPQNESIRSLWPPGKVLWPEVGGGVTVAGRPVLNLSFAINYAISGTEVWSYHVFNILIHAGSALLLFGIVRRTITASPWTRDQGPKTRDFEPMAAGLPFAIAAMWALHPLHTQAVTYTVQRAESLMGFFYLLTLYAFARGVEGRVRPPGGPQPSALHGLPGGQALPWHAISVASCALGMGTKEVMATAPLLVLLYDRTFIAGSFAAAWRARRGYYLALAATWLVLVALLVGTGGNRGGTVGLGVGLPPWAYPLTQFKAIAGYFGLAIWPASLVFEYGTFWVERARDIVPYALVVLPLVVATLLAQRRWPKVGFCGAWFFGILAPTSLAPGTIQMIVEHRVYLPLAAVVALAGVALQRIGGRRVTLALAAVGLALGMLTARRNHDYRSPLGLWSDTVAKRPLNPRAHEGLAEALAAAGRRDEAIAHRKEAVELDSKNAQTHLNLAVALAEAGRAAEAVRHYEESLRLFPGEARAHNNLAILLAREARVDDALRHYAEAQRLAPREPEYFYNHGLALTRLGRHEAALERFLAARQLAPQNAEMNLTMAEAFARARRFDDAIASYEAALRHEPERMLAHVRLADALLEVERITEAAAHYETAVRLKPDHAEAQHNLGVAYAQLERWEEARRQFEKALSLKPEYGEARRNLERLRQVMGTGAAK